MMKNVNKGKFIPLLFTGGMIMGMNPQNMMQMLGALNTFRSNHPKFASFMSIFLKGGIPEGTVIEVTVTKPGEETREG